MADLKVEQSNMSAVFKMWIQRLEQIMEKDEFITLLSDIHGQVENRWYELKRGER